MAKYPEGEQPKCLHCAVNALIIARGGVTPEEVSTLAQVIGECAGSLPKDQATGIIIAATILLDASARIARRDKAAAAASAEQIAADALYRAQQSQGKH